MPQLVKVVILGLLGAVALLQFCAEGYAEEEASKRKSRYKKRRYYTKQLDIFDESSDRTTPIPKQDTEHTKSLSDRNEQTERSAAIPGRTSNLRPSLPAPRRTPRQSEQSESGGWLVDALMKPEGSEQEAQSWGWLAKEADAVHSSDRSEMEATEDSLSVRSNATASMAEEIFGTREDISQTGTGLVVSNTAFSLSEKDLLRDHMKEIEERFQIFKSEENKDRETRANDPEEEERIASRREKDRFGGEHVAPQQDTRSDWTAEPGNGYASYAPATSSAQPFYEGTFSETGSRYGPEMEKRPQYAGSPRRNPNDSGGTSFKSPFEGNQGSAFKSPFQMHSSYGASEPQSSSYGAGSYESSSQIQSYEQTTPYGRNRSSGKRVGRSSWQRSDRDRRSSTRSDSAKPISEDLPHSVNQWD